MSYMNDSVMARPVGGIGTRDGIETRGRKNEVTTHRKRIVEWRDSGAYGTCPELDSARRRTGNTSRSKLQLEIEVVLYGHEKGD